MIFLFFYFTVVAWQFNAKTAGIDAISYHKPTYSGTSMLGIAIIGELGYCS
jgi:hypothetical protein